jgi:hypothetical protein
MSCKLCPFAVACNVMRKDKMETETIDRLFLELSQFTKATTAKELKLQAENEKLKEFVKSTIRQGCWLGGEIDGGDLQELAEKLGLIEPHIITDEDKKKVDGQYWLSDYEVGDKIYVFTEILKENKK